MNRLVKLVLLFLPLFLVLLQRSFYFSFLLSLICFSSVAWIMYGNQFVGSVQHVSCEEWDLKVTRRPLLRIAGVFGDGTQEEEPLRHFVRCSGSSPLRAHSAILAFSRIGEYPCSCFNCTQYNGLRLVCLLSLDPWIPFRRRVSLINETGTLPFPTTPFLSSRFSGISCTLLRRTGWIHVKPNRAKQY